MASLVIEETPCPVCHSYSHTLFLKACDYLISRSDFSLVRCETCGVVFTNPRVCEQSIQDYYTSDYTSFAIRRNSRVRRYIKSMISFIYQDQYQKIAYLLKNNNVRNILEIGPGNGGLITYLHGNGFDVTGDELDTACVERIQSSGIVCHQGTVEDVKDHLSTYDAVIMCNVFEHVYRPKFLLEIIHSKLSDNGLLYLTMPNIASFEARLFGKYWRGLDLPRHITHFSPDKLGCLLSNLDYSVDKITNLPFPSSFIESIAFLMTKKGRFKNSIYYPLFYIWKILSPLHVKIIGSGIMEVVARKKDVEKDQQWQK